MNQVKWQTKREWAETLNIGDKVMTNYPNVQNGWKEATIEKIVLEAFSQSGVLIKLKELPCKLDLFWIQKCYGDIGT